MEPNEITDSPQKNEKEKKPKKPGVAKGAETLFRNVYRVHVEVSAMADNKANFLISVNSIILILATAHAKEVVTDKLLLIPAAIIIFSCIGSMVFAVFAARPRITGSNTTDQTSAKGVNLLFFGAFRRVTKETYVEALTEMSKDTSSVFSAMAADIYDMGAVLEKKFKRLQSAYGFLLYGLPGGIILFLVMQTLLRVAGHVG